MTCISSQVASDKDAGREREGSYTGTGSLQGPWGFLLWYSTVHPRQSLCRRPGSSTMADRRVMTSAPEEGRAGPVAPASQKGPQACVS